MKKTEGIVEVFPEPPLTIKNQKLNTSCSIDGGIWVRKSVFISNNDSVIVTQEYSGSNDFLIFYNTENCKKIAEIDVSNSSFEINKSEIVISKKQGKNKKIPEKTQIYRLNQSCKPIKSLK